MSSHKTSAKLVTDKSILISKISITMYCGMVRRNYKYISTNLVEEFSVGIRSEERGTNLGHNLEKNVCKRKRK